MCSDLLKEAFDQSRMIGQSLFDFAFIFIIYFIIYFCTPYILRRKTSIYSNKAADINHRSEEEVFQRERVSLSTRTWSVVVHQQQQQLSCLYSLLTYTRRDRCPTTSNSRPSTLPEQVTSYQYHTLYIHHHIIYALQYCCCTRTLVLCTYVVYYTTAASAAAEETDRS